MHDQTGDSSFPIWLWGDSNPKSELNEQDAVDPEQVLTPLDPRHPTRHSILTPILDVVQRFVFVACGSRLDDSKFYIRNAVGDPAEKRDLEKRNHAVAVAHYLLKEHPPLFVATFGQFAHECVRQALQEEEKRARSWIVWNVKMLADQFEKNVSEVRLDSVNVLPLLHAVSARQFRYCHRVFSGRTGNYFNYVGGKIATVLIEHRSDPRLRRLWM